MEAVRDRAWSWWLALPALPLLVIGVFGTRGAAHQQADAVPPDLLAYVLVVIAALALLLRRRHPLLGLAICGAAVAAYSANGYPFGPILLIGPFAVYAVVDRVELRRAVLATAAFVVAVTATVVLGYASDRDWLDLVIWFVAWTAVIAAPAAIGTAMKTRRQSGQEVRAEQARRAVSEERLRVAQDVHDGVGHDLAVIAMQAGVALHVLDRSPAQARESLVAIRSASREALHGLRAELDHLRAAETPARRPTPGLADVPALVDRMRSAGAEVTLQLGEVGPLPSGVDLAAYRIVQESLTNVLRHAATSSTMISIDRSVDHLQIVVADSGRRAGDELTPPGTDGGGTGIDGMRARATALGGSLAAERTRSGFTVRARLPIDDDGTER